MTMKTRRLRQKTQPNKTEDKKTKNFFENKILLKLNINKIRIVEFISFEHL